MNGNLKLSCEVTGWLVFARQADKVSPNVPAVDDMRSAGLALDSEVGKLLCILAADNSA